MTDQTGRPLLRFSSIVLRAILALVVLGVGAGIAAALIVTKPTPPVRVQATLPLNVGTVPATRRDVPRQWIGYGTARAMEAVNLTAQVSARVIDRPPSIEAGASINAGDLIVQLEQTDYLARARAAEEMVNQAAADLASLEVDEASWREQVRLVEEQAEIERRELGQALEALERGASTPSEIDRRTKAVRALEGQVSTMRQQLDRVPSRRLGLEATLERLRADAERAGADLTRTTITSPITGVLQEVSVESGELLSVGSPIARVIDLSRIEIPVRMPASALGYVRVGDSVLLRPDGPSSRRWRGSVERIAPEAEQSTRTLIVFVEVRQDAGTFAHAWDDPPLLPGEFLIAEVMGAPEHGRTLVPRRAVLDGSVFIAVADGEARFMARRVPVEVLFHASGDYPEIDPIERQWAVIDSPIPEGTPIIVTNLDNLSDGRFIDHTLRVAQPPGDPE